MEINVNVLCNVINVINAECFDNNWVLRLGAECDGVMISIMGREYRIRQNYFIHDNELSDLAIVDPIFRAQEICRSYATEIAKMAKRVEKIQNEES